MWEYRCQGIPEVAVLELEVQAVWAISCWASYLSSLRGYGWSLLPTEDYQSNSIFQQAFGCLGIFAKSVTVAVKVNMAGSLASHVHIPGFSEADQPGGSWVGVF